MNKLQIILLSIAGVFALFVLIVIVGGIGKYNEMVTMENSIEAQWKDNQNIYDNYWKKLQETAQVTERYQEDFKEVVVAAIQGRYGDNGSQAVWQWIQENNPTLDAKMYENVQKVIAAGRADFEQSQRQLLDKNRVYQNMTKTFPGNFYATIFGMPTQVCNSEGVCKDFFAHYKIVTSAKTEKIFESGQDNEPQRVFSE